MNVFDGISHERIRFGEFVGSIVCACICSAYLGALDGFVIGAGVCFVAYLALGLIHDLVPKRHKKTYITIPPREDVRCV